MNLYNINIQSIKEPEDIIKDDNHEKREKMDFSNFVQQIIIISMSILLLWMLLIKLEIIRKINIFYDKCFVTLFVNICNNYI